MPCRPPLDLVSVESTHAPFRPHLPLQVDAGAAQGAVEPCSRTRPTATAPSPTSPSDHKASSCWQPPAAARHLPLQAQQEGKEGCHHPWAQQRDDILFSGRSAERRGFGVGAADNVWGPGKAGRVTDARNLKNLKMWDLQLIRMAFAVPTMCANFSGDAASGLAILLK